MRIFRRVSGGSNPHRRCNVHWGLAEVWRVFAKPCASHASHRLRHASLKRSGICSGCRCCRGCCSCKRCRRPVIDSWEASARETRVGHHPGARHALGGRRGWGEHWGLLLHRACATSSSLLLLLLLVCRSCRSHARTRGKLRLLSWLKPPRAPWGARHGLQVAAPATTCSAGVEPEARRRVSLHHERVGSARGSARRTEEPAAVLSLWLLLLGLKLKERLLLRLEHLLGLEQRDRHWRCRAFWEGGLS